MKGHVTGSFIGAIERGESRCQRELAVLLDDVLDTRGTLPSLWDDLVMNAAFPVWFDWPKIESQAVSLQAYEPFLIYGLLQNEEYAEVLLNGDRAAVEARMGRQALLTREDPPPPKLTVVFSELALHNQVGDERIMRTQLERLITAAATGTTIQVVPNGARRPGNTGAFVLATLENRNEVAHVDTAARGMTLSNHDDRNARRRSHAERQVSLSVPYDVQPSSTNGLIQASNRSPSSFSTAWTNSSGSSAGARPKCWSSHST